MNAMPFTTMVLKKEISKDDLWRLTKMQRCFVKGEKFEESGNFRAAILCYENNLRYSKRCLNTAGQENIASSYCNLGLAQERCGLLTAAKSNYDRLKRIVRFPTIEENLAILSEEMSNYWSERQVATPLVAESCSLGRAPV